MNSKLILEYEFSQDGDDFGWLRAEVQTSCFSGRNGMWVQWRDVIDFAASLASYPIQADRSVTEEWGFNERGQYAEITKISITPEGLTDVLAVNVSLANYYEPASRCSICFKTDYPSLDRFRAEIEQMMRDRAGSAALFGSANAS